MKANKNHLNELRKIIREAIEENIFTDIGHAFNNLTHTSREEREKNKLEDLKDQAFEEYQNINRVYVDSGDYNNMTREYRPWIRWENKNGEYLVAYESKESMQEALSEYKKDLEKFTEEYIEQNMPKHPATTTPIPSLT